MRLLDRAPLPVASTALAVLATCCPSEPAKVATTPAVVVPAPPGAPAPPPAPPVSGPPVARTVDTVDHEFGTAVPDPYRWMEGMDNPEYRTWLTAQGAYAKTELAKLPERDKLLPRIRELGNGVAAAYGLQIARGRTIYSTLPANAQLAKLATREGDQERILLDPEKLGSADKHASLNAYSLSPDGKYVGYVIAMGGGEQGEIHIMDIATGKELPDVVPAIWGEFSPSWLPEANAFFYTQIAAKSGDDPMQNMIVRYHKLGDSTVKDITVISRAADTTFAMTPQEFPFVWMDASSPWVFVNAGGAVSEQHIAIARRSELDLSGKARTPWKLVSNLGGDNVEGVFPHGDRLYVSTYKDAPNRKLISVPLAAPVLAKARVEIPENPLANLENWAVARDGIYLNYDAAGLGRIERWAWSGKPTSIPMPNAGWTSGFATEASRDGLAFGLATWEKPAGYYAYDPKAKKTAPLGIASASKFIDERVVATEVEVASSDNVMVPLSILHFKDLALDGSHPTIIDGYAAYGISQHAGFSATRLAWLERGGVIAVCHARGGGEKGRRWQDDGSRDKKLNGIRDVIACGEYLVAQHYTTAKKLAIEGGSAGGILMGRALSERPDLFAAVHIAVGMVNPLRTLAAENGANQITEVGDPRTEAGYKSILAFDPYLNLKKAAYPAVIFTVGLNDHRVAPWMTGKMAARLQALSPGRPTIVRVETDAGHGIGSTRDQAFATTADVWAFLLRQFE